MRWPPVLESVEISLRLARPADEAALRDLAGRDSAEPIQGDALIAHAGGRLLAAVSLDGERLVADPFAPTAGAVELLRLRLRQLDVPRRGRVARLALRRSRASTPLDPATAR